MWIVVCLAPMGLPCATIGVGRVQLAESGLVSVTTAVWTCLLPSASVNSTCTEAPASVLPVIRKGTPLSTRSVPPACVSVSTGGLVSTTIGVPALGAEALPALSVATAVTRWVPSAGSSAPAKATLHLPSAPALASCDTVPTVTFTVLSASAVPASVTPAAFSAAFT